MNTPQLDDERIVTPTRLDNDPKEGSLRPLKLDDFIGQHALKQNLSVFIKAAQSREESLDHVMLYGPPGLGKTTLANIIANEMGVNIKTTSGPAIERPGDLAAILTNLQEGDILFIDEIHRLNRSVEEVLYPAMEDFELDIMIGKGPSARSIRLDIPKFTLIGATTRLGLLSSPLRDRFGFSERCEFYTPDDLNIIISRAATILNTSIDPDSALSLARRSRGTPRIANRLLKRVRDWTHIEDARSINDSVVKTALAHLSIDELGLDPLDRQYLTTIITKFKGGPVGVDTIAASMAEEKESLEDVVEPFLLQLGFIDRTARGRMATSLAYQHLNIAVPNSATLSQSTPLFDS